MSLQMDSVRQNCLSFILGIENEAQLELKTPETLDDVTEGTEVQLRCLCEGAPEPSIEWFRNGER